MTKEVFCVRGGRGLYGEEKNLPNCVGGFRYVFEGQGSALTVALVGGRVKVVPSISSNTALFVFSLPSVPG